MSGSEIAIIGMAGRFPQARDLAQFWRNLTQARNCVTFFSTEELLSAGISRDDVERSGYVKAGAVLEDAEWFDADFFSIDRQEAQILDPQHRVMLECAHAALEDAGYNPRACPGRVGVYVGSSASAYLLDNLQQRYRQATPLERLQLTLANDKDFLPTRLSYKLNLKGPSVSVNTATSTSLVSVHLACRSLLNGECDVALAGAVSIRLPQVSGYPFQEGMILSPDGLCRAFDRDAAGTIFGSGAGVVALKRLTDAVRDRDYIRAVVKGTAVNNDGAARASYTSPSVEGQAAVISDAMSVADVEPDSISYVEAHGTGTRAGDPVEVAALTLAHRRHSSARHYCALGSVKTNIGHLYAAAGVAGLIKTVLMLENRTLVPTLHFREPNSLIDFRASPFFVQTKTESWKAVATGPLRAGVSSFGMGGTNAHAILEEAPTLERGPQTGRPELIVISARTEAQLEQSAADLRQHLHEHPELLARDVAYTLAVGREHCSHRRFLIGGSSEEVAQQLARATFTQADPALQALGGRWLQGEKVDWAQHFATREARRVSLPTYPFDRKPYWVDGAVAASDALPPAPSGDIAARLQHQIAAKLGPDSSALPDVNCKLMELGLESLTLIDVINQLSTQLGVVIPASWLIEYPTIGALANRVNEMGVAALPQKAAAAPHAPARASRSSRCIAVIGMTGRFPGAHNLERFWENLRDGVESISRFSPRDLQASGSGCAFVGEPDFILAQGVLQDIECFDHQFFEYSPAEAALIDPQQRLFLEESSAALETAGYDPDRYPGRIGVFAGVSTNTYLYNNVFPSHASPDSTRQFHVMLANDKDYLSTRVSYKLNLKGPSYTIQTACSTSLVAVHVACQSLLAGECDMALAGGVSVRVPQVTGYFHEEGMILSKDGRVRPFDAGANGTVWGNGVGVVVLKPLEQALKDEDTIHAVIRGSATNNDGALKASYAAPSKDGQARAILDALTAAQVDAGDVTYIEAHGTGTLLGDPVEVAALTQAFRARTTTTGHCAIGAVKSNVGHLDAAAGVAGVIKTALMLGHRQLVPTVNFENPNPNIDFRDSPFYVSRQRAFWNARSGKRLAGVTSLGVGGTNAHVILEEAPERGPSPLSPRPHLLLLSAKTQDALDRLGKILDDYLREHPDINPADVAYTLSVGRRAFKYRRARVFASADPGVSAETRSPEPAITFAFSRLSGAQLRLPDARTLFAREPLFRRPVEACYAAVNKEPPADLFTNSCSGRLEAFIACYSLAAFYRSLGLHPRVVVGQGLGELVGAVIAGSLSLRQALQLVTQECPEEDEQPFGRKLTIASANVVLCIGSLPDWAVAQTLDGFDTISCLAQLWIRGATINWQRYYESENRRRVTLPTYPFSRHRHWIERPASHADSQVRERAVETTLARYVPVWNPIIPVGRGSININDMPLVIGASDRHREWIRQLSPRAQFVSFGPEDSIELIARRLGARPIDHLLWIAPESRVRAGDEALVQEQRAGVIQVFRITRALLSLGYASRELEYTLVTHNTQQVFESERIEPSHAGVHGFAGSLAKELERWTIRPLDLDRTAEWPCTEIFQFPKPDGNTLVWRQGEWFSRQLVPVESLTDGAFDVREGGVYVVIDGADGMGAALARHLAEKYHAHIVSIGPLPSGEGRESLAQECSQVKQRFSRVDGVIHCADAVPDADLANMKEDELFACLSAAVDVSVSITQVWGDDPPDLVVFFSSAQSFSRSSGKAHTAAASTFMDAFACCLNKQWRSAVKTVNWGSSDVLNDRERSTLSGVALEELIRASLPQLVITQSADPELAKRVSVHERYRAYRSEAPSLMDALRRTD